MTTPRPIPFAEFRAFLQKLGYVEERTDNAVVFRHPREGLLVFRSYQEGEVVDTRDLLVARKFLDLRGLLDTATFDAFLMGATTSA
jgi:hypothetical protein